ncbi:DUF833-domain-containing protein [Abortiporus biennis]|nr:DUF833-domain-containing protein [Abortiporus biennis]
MCVGFWSLEHPEYALVLCSNRDEYLSRPTAAAHFHSFQHLVATEDAQLPVLSGRDLRAGGTWLGMTRAGRVALLTNITEEPKHYDSTRGHLVSSFLLPEESETTLQEHVDVIEHENIPYAGFNLLLLSPSFNHTEADQHEIVSYEATYVTNSGGGGDIKVRHLQKSERICGGMSNGVDGHGADSWPKVKHGTELFDEVLKSTTTAKVTDEALSDRLFNLLTWQCEGGPPNDRSQLRNTIHVAPFSVSASKHPEGKEDFYGTRLSTVILVHRDGHVTFIERDIWVLDEEGKVKRADANSQRVFKFQLSH